MESEVAQLPTCCKIQAKILCAWTQSCECPTATSEAALPGIAQGAVALAGQCLSHGSQLFGLSASHPSQHQMAKHGTESQPQSHQQQQQQVQAEVTSIPGVTLSSWDGNRNAIWSGT